MNNYLYTISAATTFCASLKLKLDDNGRCSQPHGYTYQVMAELSTNQLDANGMAYNYDLLLSELTAICQQLDYTDLNQNPCLANINPTCEQLATWILTSLTVALRITTTENLVITISTKPGVTVRVRKC